MQTFMGYEMYTPEGNEAVARHVEALVAEIKAEAFPRSELLSRYGALMQAIEVEGHEEVFDTEPRGHILDQIEAACREAGWTPPVW